MDREQLNLAVVMFVLMFIISGGNKVLNFNTPESEGARLSKVIKISLDNKKLNLLLSLSII